MKAFQKYLFYLVGWGGGGGGLNFYTIDNRRNEPETLIV